MSDSFALLDEPRRPWLDGEALRSKFLALSNGVHPDRFHSAPESERLAATARYTALNAAYNTLKEPRDRLSLLLELELGAKPKDVQRIPPGTMDLFVEVGQLCRDVDTYLAQRANITSPLLKVKSFEQGMEWTDKLQALSQRIMAKREELTSELQQMNRLWETAPPLGSAGRAGALPLERLEQIYRVFSYIARWAEQIQDRTVQLAAGAF